METTITADMNIPIPIFRQAIIDTTLLTAQKDGYTQDGSLADLTKLLTAYGLGESASDLYDAAYDKDGLFADWYKKLTGN